MPLTDSYLLSTNDTLTVEFSGIYSLFHQTNLSDNPQTKTLWFGSLLITRILEASSDPGVDDIVISIIDSLPVWEDTTAYMVGDCIQPTVANGKRYRCVDAGTSHATTEPTWPISGIGSTVADGTVIWELQSNKHETTEITLALNEADLETNVAGDPLIISTSIPGGVDDAVEIWIKIENDLTTVTNTGTIPDVSLSINSITEREV
jgi:hypothetical protein